MLGHVEVFRSSIKSILPQIDFTGLEQGIKGVKDLFYDTGNKPQNFAATIVSVPCKFPERLICGTDL